MKEDSSARPQASSAGRAHSETENRRVMVPLIPPACANPSLMACSLTKGRQQQAARVAFGEGLERGRCVGISPRSPERTDPQRVALLGQKPVGELTQVLLDGLQRGV